MYLSKTVDLVNDPGLWLVAGKYGIGLMEKATGNDQYISRFPLDKERVETFTGNDAAVDSQGRFWVGTMHDPMSFEKFDGSLWRFDPDLTVHEVIKGGAGIPNGISWSPDDKTMYLADSSKHDILAYDFDAKSGEVSNERTFNKQIQPENGICVPDGHAMDVEGCIWSAFWGGSKLVRFSPQGDVVAEVLLPTTNVTDVIFVDEDVYITTARNEAQPETSGHLYKCHVGIKGQPLTKFALSKELLAKERLKL